MAEGGTEDPIVDSVSILSESAPLPELERVKNATETLAKDIKVLCDEELQHHRSCGQPGAPPCLLEQTLQSLDSAVRVDQFTPQAISIRDAVKGLIQVITDTVASLKPYFECKIHCKGSSFNGLKIGRPDEFDFMLELVNFTVEESGRWQIASDDKRFDGPESISRIHRRQTVGLENLYQVQRQHFDHTCDREVEVKPTTGDETFEERYNILITEREVLGQCLSAHEIKETFSSLLGKACDLLSVAENSRDETCIRVAVKGSGKLLLFLLNVEYAVKVDLTPCIRAEPANSPSLFLVPSTKVDSWMVANEDPVQLSIETVSKTIRIFKTLKEIIEYFHRELDFEATCLSQDVMFIFHESTSSENYVLQDVNSRELIDLCSLPVLGQLLNFHSTFIWNCGYCFHVLSETAKFSVCALILESIKEFKFVDPKNVPLLTSQWEGYELDMNNILHEMLLMLEDLKMGHEALASLLEDNLPPWFRCSHQVLTKHIRENFEAVETVLWGRQTSNYLERFESGSDTVGASISHGSDGAKNEQPEVLSATEQGFTLSSVASMDLISLVKLLPFHLGLLFFFIQVITAIQCDQNADCVWVGDALSFMKR